MNKNIQLKQLNRTFDTNLKGFLDVIFALIFNTSTHSVNTIMSFSKQLPQVSQTTRQQSSKPYVFWRVNDQTLL